MIFVRNHVLFLTLYFVEVFLESVGPGRVTVATPTCPLWPVISSVLKG